MTPACRLALLPVFALCFLGMAKKESPITVRFHAEANERDTEKFAAPVPFKNPPRQGFIERVPVISERQIKAIYPFEAPDGTWGCAFKLNDSGRIRLEVVSTERRGSSIVAFIATKLGGHQVVDMVVDKPVRDGIINIPHGLTLLEIQMLEKQFPTLGATKKKRK